MGSEGGGGGARGALGRPAGRRLGMLPCLVACLQAGHPSCQAHGRECPEVCHSRYEHFPPSARFDPEHPGPKPDPERWLPKWQRADARKGRKKRRDKVRVTRGAWMLHHERVCFLLVVNIGQVVAGFSQQPARA